jgi:hypothetical protein
MNSGIINFAFPKYFGWAYQAVWNGDGNPSYTYIYTVQMGQFDCNMQNVQVYTPTCFATNSDFFKYGQLCQDGEFDIWQFDEGYKDQILSGPQSPLWTGATYNGNVVELRAEAQGNTLGNQVPPMWYSINEGAVNCVGPDCYVPGGHDQGQWTNNGVGGAVNPSDGTSWLSYSCSYFNGDTCQGPPDGTPWINLVQVITPPTGVNWCTMDTSKFGSGEIAYSMPAMTFWQGKLWLAWESSTGQIIVASIAPSNIVWTGQPCVNGQYCTSNSQCCSGLCQGGTCVACLATGWACTTNSQCCTGNCVSGICSTKCNGVLNGNSPDCL